MKNIHNVHSYVLSFSHDDMTHLDEESDKSCIQICIKHADYVGDYQSVEVWNTPIIRLHVLGHYKLELWTDTDRKISFIEIILL